MVNLYMKGILLVNMGGPQSLEEMKFFLKNMFCDRHILPLPVGLRHFVAGRIAQKRYQSSWAKYKMIGGSPIMQHTQDVALALEKEVKLPVYPAYSYSSPLIQDVICQMVDDGIKSIQVLTMYPQASDTTTSSVFKDITKATRKLSDVKINMIFDYSVHPAFMKYWRTLIEDHIKAINVDDPLLLFTAHSVPLYVVRHGDKYPDTIKHMAKRLATLMNHRHDLAFQSRVGPVKWVGPDTDKHLEELVRKGEKRIVLIPISFTTECLETAYDLNLKLVDVYHKKGILDHISRVEIPSAHPLFIETLKQVINE